MADFRKNFIPWFGSEISFAVLRTLISRFSRLPIVTSKLCTFNCSAPEIFALMWVAARVEIGADFVGAQFG